MARSADPKGTPQPPDPDPKAYRLAAARGATARGWALTPLNGKVPVLAAWTTQPKPPPRELDAWARKGNLGLRTGDASGVFVIDVDSKASPADVEAMGLPPTVTVETGGGGRHYYFNHPEGLGNTASSLAPHVDTRGEGGQVVYPGSVHPKTGKMYYWADTLDPDSIPLADLPTALLARLRPKAPPAPTPRPSTAPLGGVTAYGKAALERACSDVASASEGTRNATLNREAFGMGQLIAGGQLEESPSRDALRASAEAAGLAAGEINSTLDSGLRKGKQSPRFPTQRLPANVVRHPASETPAPDPEPDTSRPVILTPGTHLVNGEDYVEVGNHDFTDAVIARLPEGALYRRADLVGELLLAGAQTHFQRVSVSRLRSILDRYVRMVKWSTVAGSGQQIFQNMNSDRAELVLSDAQLHPLVRNLRCIATFPVYVGEPPSLVMEGWNPKHEIWYEPPDFSVVPERDERAIHAVLTDLVTDFPFQTEADRQNFFGLLLTPILRPALKGNVPMHLIHSPLERTGKTKLAEEVLGGIILGRPTPAMQLTERDEERDKRILALLLRGEPIVHLDNLREYLDSAALSSLLTSTSYTGRMLGVSDIVSAPNAITLVASGNNVRMTGEMAKRTVSICLAPASSHPENRTDYRHPNLRAFIAESRQRVLGCLLGMVENWRAAGCPAWDQTYGGFESWSQTIGGILGVAGFVEHRGNQGAFHGRSDTDAQDLEALVEKWYERWGVLELASKDVCDIAHELGLFARIMSKTTESNRYILFGLRVLSRYQDAPVGEFRIRRGTKASNSRWSLERVAASTDEPSCASADEGTPADGVQG